MTPFAKRALAACAIASAVETVLLLQIAAPVLLLFVLGPLLFLAIIAWRRRKHPARSQRLASLALGMSAFGIVAFAVACFYPRKDPDRPAIAPLFTPLAQWLAILFVWLKMTIEESREKRQKPSQSA